MPLAPALQRRRLLHRLGLLPLSPLLALAGCAAPWPEVPAGAGSSSARARLREAADAHGLSAWQRLQDVNVGFDTIAWPTASGLAGAGAAQLRLLPGAGIAALQTAGTASSPVATDMAPAALAAAWHRLLLLGPLVLAGFDGAVNWAEPVTLNGQRCDHIHLRLAPGLGGAAGDRLSLFIDRDQAWLRRLQVSISALGDNALTQVDLARHRLLHGMLWPLQFNTVGSKPLAWSVTGLDVNRGYPASALQTTPWAGRAAAPASRLGPTES